MGDLKIGRKKVWPRGYHTTNLYENRVYVIVYMAVLTAAITLETHFLPAAWGTGGINIGPSGGFLCAMPLPYVFSFIMLFVFSYTGFKVKKPHSHCFI